MNLTEMRAALRLELKDSGTVWSDDELLRCITEAVADLSRYLPNEKMQEVTITYEVASEAWTAASAPGIQVSLANKPIEWDSEEVKDNASVICVRDTDYRMDYSSGKITHISGGKISNGEVCSIIYKKSRITLDISSLDILRIVRVEYPLGSVPQDFVTYNIFGNYLTVTTPSPDTVRSQTRFSAKKHLVIYYATFQTPPTADASGSYPLYLDEVIIKGASAYALMIKILEFEHLANTKLSLVTAFRNGAVPSAKAYLELGDDKIDGVNIGPDVSALYSTYAQRCNDIADGFISEAERYISLADRFRGDALDRRTEFLGILRDRAELRTQSSLVSSRQPK